MNHLNIPSKVATNISTRKAWLFFTIICLSTLSGTEVDIFIPSFPELQLMFELTTTEVNLTLSINFIAFCISCIFAGALGDKYNRKKVIIIGLFIFCLGSLICSAASSFKLLLLGRLLQGAAIAPISVLSFVIISDEYPLIQQQSLIGILNGVTNFCMSLAPVIGSYVTFWGGWRYNFLCLFIMGVICLLNTSFGIPNKVGNPDVSLSLKSYLPLCKSYKFIIFFLTISTSLVPFWVFVSISPILYMNDFGVELKYFGYYQGAVCGTFSLISILSPKLLRIFGSAKCFKLGIICCIVGFLLTLFAILTDNKTPLFLTLSITIFSVGTIFPINIIYPLSLEIVKGSKGKSSAFLLSVKWILISAALQIVSYFYDHSFKSVGIVISIFIIFFFCCLYKIKNKNWLPIN